MVQQPLNDRIQIVKNDGTPTQYFIRLLQDRGISLDGKITYEEAEQLVQDGIAEWSANRDIIAGVGLSGGGSLDSDVTINLDANLDDLNDVNLSTPPVAGQVLGFDGTEWLAVDQTGGSGGEGRVLDLCSDRFNNTSYSDAWATQGIRVTPTSDCVIYSLIPSISFQTGEIVEAKIYEINSTTGAFISLVATSAAVTFTYSYNGYAEIPFLTPANLITGTHYALVIVRTDGTSTTPVRFNFFNGAQAFISAPLRMVGAIRWSLTTVPSVGALPTSITSGFPIYSLGVGLVTGGGGSSGVTSVDVESNIPGIDATGGPVTSSGIIDLDLTDVNAFRAAIGLSPIDSYFDVTGTGDYLMVAGGASVLSWE